MNIAWTSTPSFESLNGKIEKIDQIKETQTRPIKICKTLQILMKKRSKELTKPPNQIKTKKIVGANYPLLEQKLFIQTLFLRPTFFGSTFFFLFFFSGKKVLGPNIFLDSNF